MISVAEATCLVTSAFRALPAEQVALPSALGRVLAEDVASRVTQPPADVSAMDGYAVRAVATARAPSVLRVIGESAAGQGFAGRVGAGEAVRISTGAPLPAGADAIVIQEETERDGEKVTLREKAVPGRWIRRAGLDFAAGQILLRAGRRLRVRDLALAAAMNVPWLAVRRRPRIALLATGNEVVMPGDPLRPDQIPSSNSVFLHAAIRVLGGEPIDLGIAGDDEGVLSRMLERARGADLLITCGGASVGDHDLVGTVLGKEGLELGFYKVAMRPGKPLIFGRLGEVPVLGLPGNPVSVGVTTLLYVKPAMEVMLGIDGAPPAVSARLDGALPGNDERQDYLRARLSRGDAGEWLATPFERQDSAMLALFTAADCLIVRPPFAPPAAAGERVEIVPLELTTVSL